MKIVRFDAKVRVIVSVGAGGWLAAAAIINSACTPDYVFTERLPPGDGVGPVAYPIPGSCSGNEYLAIPFPVSGDATTPCSYLNCCDDEAGPGGCLDFAVCDDGSFSVCSCVPLLNGSLVEAGADAHTDRDGER